MDNLKAIATTEGLDILNSELDESVKKFILIGDTVHNNTVIEQVLQKEDSVIYNDLEDYIFYESNIESSFYDDEGVLTFNALIPVEQDLRNYVYAVGIITDDNKLVSVAHTPRIALIKGMGGTFVIKVAIKGEAGEIVYKHSEYVTASEAEDLFLYPIIENTNLNITMQNKLIENNVVEEDANVTELGKVQNSIDALQTQIDNLQNNIFQVGEIVIRPVDNIPDNLLECDGRSLDTITYSNLFKVIGYTYGGSDSNFNIPDLRGEFIRGWDHGKGVDSGRALGSFQEDEFKSHQHTAYLAITSSHGSDFNHANMASSNNTGGSYPKWGEVGGAETRPRNIAMMYCIRY